MAYEAVLYEKSDRVATITLNRPDALNAFNAQLSADLASALREAESDEDIRCVVLTGAGRAFSAGADVRGWDRSIQQREQAAEPPSPLVIPGPPRESLLSFVMGMTKPVIAALNGAAVGMGATIPVCCDLRTAAESARIAFVFARRGLTPELGSTFFLPRLVGLGKAREICYTGRFISAKEAKEIGLVNEVFPDGELQSGTMELARSIAANPPISIRFIKRGMNMALDGNLRDVVEFEHWAFATCQKSEDFKEGVRAFLEKREPEFKGR